MKRLVYYLISFVTLTTNISGQSTEKPSDKAHRECAEEVNLNPALIYGNHWEETQDDPVYKEYMLCFCKKMGFLNQHGEFQKDVIRSALTLLFSEDQLDDVVNKCVIKKNTLQESAYETIKCIDIKIPRQNTKS